MSLAPLRLARPLAQRLLADYRINWIYAIDRIDPAPPCPVERETAGHRAVLARSATPKIRASQTYARAGLAGLVLVEQGAPVSVAHFALPGQYDHDDIWPLRPGEVALVDIATEQAARGRGLAVALLRASARHYLEAGHPRLIAFIWWSNKPSLRAFGKAGWRRIGLSVAVRRRHRWRSLQIALPAFTTRR